MGGADGTGLEFYLQAALFHKTAATYKCICEVLECNSSFKKILRSHTHTYILQHNGKGGGAILSITIPLMSMSM